MCMWSVVSDSLQLHGLQLTRLLYPWKFPGILEWIASIPRDLPNPWIKSESHASPALVSGFFTIAPPEKCFNRTVKQIMKNCILLYFGCVYCWGGDNEKIQKMVMIFITMQYIIILLKGMKDSSFSNVATKFGFRLTCITSNMKNISYRCFYFPVSL